MLNDKNIENSILKNIEKFFIYSFLCVIDKIIEFIESFRMKSLFKNDNSDSTISSDDYNKDMSLNKLNLSDFELNTYLQKAQEVWVKSLSYALEQIKTEDINTIEYLFVILSILESRDKLEIHPNKYFSFIPYMTLSKLLFLMNFGQKVLNKKEKESISESLKIYNNLIKR